MELTRPFQIPNPEPMGRRYRESEHVHGRAFTLKRSGKNSFWRIRPSAADPVAPSLTLILINASRVRRGVLPGGVLEQGMPLARYFSVVGGVLLALLFVLDACFPKLPVAAKAKVYLPVIRIYSDRKWPERIVYDTSLPTPVSASIVATERIIDAPAMIAAASGGAREREAFAMLSPSDDRSKASNTRMRELKPRYHRKIARRRAPAPTLAMARQPQFGWFGGNFW
jgi:hypothetical protein